MATPKLNMAEIAEAQAQKYLTHNTALRVLDALVQGNVINKDLFVPPESPSDGDTYVVATTDSTSGDWEDHDDDVAYYQSSSWVFFTPTEGWRVYVQDEGAVYTFWGASVGWAEAEVDLLDLGDTPSSYVGQASKVLRVNAGEDAVEFKADPFEVGASFNGKPSAGEVLLRVPFTQSVNFADDLAGSRGMCDTGPADSLGVDLAIKKNGVEFATMSFADSATTATFSTSSTDEDFAPGDVLTVEAPDPQDASFADGGFTLRGTKL